MKKLLEKYKLGGELLLIAYSLVIVSFFLPNRINSTALLIFGAISLPFAFKKMKLLLKQENVLMFLLFGVLCLGLFYSSNLKEGVAIVERHLSLVLLPLFLTSFTLLKKQQKFLLLDIFIFSSFIAGLYCLGYASYNYFESGTVYPTGQTGHFIYNRFMHHRLSSAIGIHAIYFSFYCSIAAIAVLQKLLFANQMDKQKRIGNSFLFIFFLVLLFLLKSSLFAFIMPLSCLLLVFIKLKDQLLKPKYATAFFMICIFTALISYQGIRSKLDSFKTSYTFEDTTMRPLAIRLALWTSSWSAIQENVVLGVGTGDGQDTLMKEFKRIEFTLGKENNFNAHNMYLQYWLSNGILSALLFVAFLSLLFVKAIRYQNFLFFAFTLFFTFFSMTESTMLKQKGIVFFVFFAFLFLTDPNCWTYSSQTSNENNSSS